MNNEIEYTVPQDDIVRKKISEWQDLKLGFMVHWGTYSQWGIVESWALSGHDADWSRKDISFDEIELKERYQALIETFNPVRFNPYEWAEAAFEGGFKYLIFTTKHHDGFAMYDTKYSDYKITSASCPFNKHPYADITRVLFDAFRAKEMLIGVYFSKPDWRCPYYWEPGKPSRYPSRGPTYSPLADTDKWNRFKSFVHAQIGELMCGYGDIDILWLDGGWVKPRNDGQDLDMKMIAAQARSRQNGLIIVDRTVGGEFENYVTPEQTVPDKPLLIPWESNITMGTSFSYKYDDVYKSERELIHLLIEVVSKGGNLVLNAGARPDGCLPEPALKRMAGIGVWLKRFGEAIYGTKPCAPYWDGVMGYTRSGKRKYVIRTLEEKEIVKELVVNHSGTVRSVTMVGRDIPLQYTARNGMLYIEIPELLPEEKIAFAAAINE